MNLYLVFHVDQQEIATHEHPLRLNPKRDRHVLVGLNEWRPGDLFIDIEDLIITPLHHLLQPIL